MAQLFLHDAMQLILKEKSRAMTAQELADEINTRKLYIQKDGYPVSTKQITDRAMNKNYADLFDVIICLRDEKIK